MESLKRRSRQKILYGVCKVLLGFHRSSNIKESGVVIGKIEYVRDTDRYSVNN